jgi:hypothetical protein
MRSPTLRSSLRVSSLQWLSGWPDLIVEVGIRMNIQRQEIRA